MNTKDDVKHGETAATRPCDTCGNIYDKAFEVTIHGGVYTFDCFECAAHRLAPHCTHCGCTVLGHGVEQAGLVFCGAHCARREGIGELCDRVETEPELEISP